MSPRIVVVDMYHGDASEERDGKLVDLVDFAKAKEFGIQGIIHKATEGARDRDPLYASRRAKAVAAGLMWGAYHFMRPGDVGDQVSNFLTVAGHCRPGDPPEAWIRYMLDYEDDRLAIWQAERFLEVVHIATEQRAWLYGGGVLRDQTDRREYPSLIQYPLVLAEYSEVARIPRPWSNYILWQRSGDGEGPGPHDIPGIGRKQDIDYFDGTDEDLRAMWFDAGAGKVAA